MAIAEESILAALRQVQDPELFVNIVDLGLVYEVQATDSEAGTSIVVKMTMTSPACPAGPELIRDAKDVLSGLEGVEKVDIQIVMDPPWTPERMTDEARDELGIF